MASSASRSVEERSVLARSTDAKPYAAHGMDQRIGLMIVDLAPHPPDVNVDNVGVRIEMQVPHVLQQHRARDRSPLVADQILEYLELARQQIEGAAAALARARDEVELEIADAQHGFLDHRGAAPGQRLDAREQFREGKRLDQIVVAAGAQAAYPLVDFAERADDQRRRGNAVFAQALDDRPPLHPPN